MLSKLKKVKLVILIVGIKKEANLFVRMIFSYIFVANNKKTPDL